LAFLIQYSTRDISNLDLPNTIHFQKTIFPNPCPPNDRAHAHAVMDCP
jgi:hypothetical protein